MSWSINMTSSGWDNVLENLRTWSKSKLIGAIRDDYNEKTGKHKYPVNLWNVAHDTLVDNAMELIRENNTCDRGGYNVYIDKEGWYKVSTSCKGEEHWEKYPF